MQEHIFHKLWESRAFASGNLHTVCGRKLVIHSTGTLNTWDGPDFSEGCVEIDGLLLHGSIELHIHCNDWFNHGHSNDRRYNKTILHVVLYPDDARSVPLQDGTEAPTLVLYQHLHPGWQTSLFAIRQHEELACTGFLHDLSPAVIKHQLDKSADQYFKQKRTDLMRFYDSSLPPSQAFLKMFYMGWSDGLGIPANRHQMIRLSETMWPHAQIPAGFRTLQSVYEPDDTASNSREVELTNLALFYSGFGNNNAHGVPQNATSVMHASEWKQKSGRPGNRPKARIIQSALLLAAIEKLGFGWFLHHSVEYIRNWLSEQEFGKGERGKVLNHTVLLPTLHILGEIMHKPALSEKVRKLWLWDRVPVPREPLNRFRKAGGDPEIFGDHPGTLPHFRTYCRTKSCENCFIFKNILRG